MSKKQTRYILAKITKGGVTHFFTGSMTLQENPEGSDLGASFVARTGFLPGDAVHYRQKGFAEQAAGFLNEVGIGGNPWSVAEVEVEAE